MTKDDGGPAFPGEHYEVRFDEDVLLPHGGMSLRDWFAGQAISTVGEIALAAVKSGGLTSIEDIGASLAQATYEVADAMLEERKK